MYSHFSLKRAFITSGVGLLKRVQSFSPAMYRLLNRIFNQIVLSRFHYKTLFIDDLNIMILPAFLRLSSL